MLLFVVGESANEFSRHSSDSEEKIPNTKVFYQSFVRVSIPISPADCLILIAVMLLERGVGCTKAPTAEQYHCASLIETEIWIYY